jgi:hypothetical protein
MIIAVNHKLTHVVKDRVVQYFQLNAPELLISFVDGSTMKVKSWSPIAHHFGRVPESAGSQRIEQNLSSNATTTAQSI